MKKTLLIAVVMLFAGALSAQNEMAILNHEGTLTPYYGTTAMSSAMTDAVSGDVITLSSGTFICNSINEGITVNGNGFEEDLDAGGLQPTIINTTAPGTNFQIWANASVSGIYFNNSYSYVRNDDVKITKCRFRGELTIIRPDGNYTPIYRTKITSCFIEGNFRNDGNETVITNSVINNYTSAGSAGATIYNSIVYVGNYGYATNGNNGSNTHGAGTFNKCILITGSSYVNRAQTGCYNCVGIANSSDGFFANAINYTAYQDMTSEEQAAAEAAADMSHGNYNASSYADVFQNYRGGSYTERLDFSLTTAYQTLITEFGIYQGMYPYTPFVNRPRYVNTTVSPRTTTDGKLSVNIQVVTE